MRKYTYVKSPGHKKTSNREVKEIAIARDDGTFNVVPILSVDTKLIVFRTKCLMTDFKVKEIERKLSEDIGIKCIVIDPHTELAAVIDG